MPWMIDVDWLNRDKAYWRSIYQRARLTAESQRLGFLRCKYIARRRYEERINAQRFDWEKAYDADTVTWLHDQIAMAIQYKGHLCNDNRRAADWSKSTHRRHYRRQRGQGCCGFYDAFVTAPDGRIFQIGFNYGH